MQTVGQNKTLPSSFALSLAPANDSALAIVVPVGALPTSTAGVLQRSVVVCGSLQQERSSIGHTPDDATILTLNDVDLDPVRCVCDGL